MIYHGDCGCPCQLPSHGSTICHPHAGLLQLTLWEYLIILVRYHCHFFFVSTSLVWWSSSQSCPIGFWSTTGIMPQTCLLNIMVARLGRPWPIGIVHNCNSAMFLFLPDLAHFLDIGFINLMQASTCPLLWWWYANDIVCSMLIDLQKCLNFSETKLVPASDISFHGIPYSVNIDDTALMSYSADSPCSFLMIGNLLL